MSHSSVERSALFAWLSRRSHPLSAKALELRESAEAWLSYIPETFPHYTRHTVDHSDEIVRQLSSLLFFDANPDRLALPDLSTIEAYVLIASAYLHDMGMVASEKEKEEILSSPAWREWVSPESEAGGRLARIETFREAEAPSDSLLRSFLADRQLRYLIAEFVRRTHHERSGAMLRALQSQLGRFAFDDNRLASAISSICVGHGLNRHELEDGGRFPQETDLRGEKANLQLCAILLRLADLLDLRTDRACSLLLNAACPLPGESIAHWSQFQCIGHMSTAPDRIEIHARCANPDEHRVLRDWCKWIEDETIFARMVMPSARRHRGWIAPTARVGRSRDDRATIVVEPAPEARYKDVDWKFELDEVTVFDRLIRDVYSSDWVFVRELVQNAADATRCRMCVDLEHVHGTPQDTRLAPPDWRERYPIVVTVEEGSVHSEHSGAEEKTTIVSVDDRGIGMTKDVIERYLLQVGRSYYTSPEFQRRFSFHPASRFGIGFLSVFGASSFAEVETYCPDGPDGPMRLVLTGPRNYLLVETGTRRTPGTIVRVRLRAGMSVSGFSEMVARWCRRLEFPVIVREGGEEKVLRAERPEDFAAEYIEKAEQPITHFNRIIGFSDRGVSGELYVVAKRDSSGESWDLGPFQAREVRERTLAGDFPTPPGRLICFNGIALSEGRDPFDIDECVRVDCRSRSLSPVLSRADLREDASPDGLTSIVRTQWESALLDHLKQTDVRFSTWRYRQRLANHFSQRLEAFWSNLDGMVPLWNRAEAHAVSLRRTRELEAFWFHTGPSPVSQAELAQAADLDEPLFFSSDCAALCRSHRQRPFLRRHVGGIRRVPTGGTVVRWTLTGSTLLGHDSMAGPSLLNACHVFSLAHPEVFAAFLPGVDSHFWIVLNPGNSLADWCIRVWRSGVPLGPELPSNAAQRLQRLIIDAVYRSGRDSALSLNRFLDEWSTLSEGSTSHPPGERLGETSIAHIHALSSLSVQE
jgi:molecular chaperone HtpG